MNNRKRHMAPPVPYDRWLIATVLTLIAFGLLMVASASIVVSDKYFNQPFYYLLRQMFGVFLGVFAGGILVQFKISFWEKAGGVLLVGAMLLLALVLIPGIGHTVNGSTRWIGYSVFRIQVSEIAKLCVIIYIAGYLFRQNKEIADSLSGFLKPLGLLGVISILLLKEPDFGAAVVIIATSFGMMFLAGMRLQHFLVLLLCSVIVLSLVAVSETYRLQRLTSFMNPWANPFDSGYQLTQSLIAFGRGGWFGLGLGNSIQKLFYLPESYTDFIFAVIAEEFGLVGTILVISLFTFLVVRTFMIGRKAQLLKKPFAGFLAYGFGFWLAIQFAVSVGVNSGLLPTKGLTLPLVSYGGSSMLINCIVIAFILRIDYENRMKVLGLRYD